MSCLSRREFNTPGVTTTNDLLQCDAGIQYLRYYTDHAEWGYFLDSRLKRIYQVK